MVFVCGILFVGLVVGGWWQNRGGEQLAMVKLGVGRYLLHHTYLLLFDFFERTKAVALALLLASCIDVEEIDSLR